MKLIKQQLNGISIKQAPQVGTRTPNILMGEHQGEYLRGDIMDANAVIQAFDELKDGVDDNHDTLNELNEEIKTNATTIDGAITYIHKVEEESKSRDDAATKSLNNEISRATAAEKANKARIDVIDGDSDTEGSYRKAVKDLINGAPEAYDTLKEIADKLATNDDLHKAIQDAITAKAEKTALTAEVTRATAAEEANATAIATKADKTSLDAEVTRATAKEKEISDSVSKEISDRKAADAALVAKTDYEADKATFAKKAEIPTKVSQLTNDAKYLTSYTETDPVWTAAKPNYYTKTEIDGKGFLTEHQSLTDYAKKTDLTSKADSTDVTALQTKIADLEKRIAALEAKQAA